MKKYAIIKTGSRQYFVWEKQDLDIEKIDGETGKKIEFDQVLLALEDERVFIGEPFVVNAKVTAQIKKQFKDKKVNIIKFRAKSRYRRKTGHRQEKTQIIIDKIILPTKKIREK